MGGVTPTDESFFASKSMILITGGISAIVLLVLVGIAVLVLFGQDPFTIVSAGIAGISAHTAGGVVRNIQTDGPIRQQVAANQFPPPVPLPPGSIPL